MQQRQLRPGDILDDYCPRERRLTNHVVVAMIGDDIKQTRCTTCDSDHEYKHARVPRQRKKSDAPAILSPVASVAPKRVAHESHETGNGNTAISEHQDESVSEQPSPAPAPVPEDVQPDLGDRRDIAMSPEQEDEEPTAPTVDEGPVHRPLIRAQLPRNEGQPPVTRQAPDFTIRQPGGRQNRFRPRHQRGGAQQFQGNRSNGNMGNTRGGPPRPPGGRPPLMSHLPKRHGSGGRKRSK
jgi:hypothetical protein